MTSRREQQVQEWLEREEIVRDIQRREAQQRAEDFMECEKGIGHVFTLGSDVCANCLCRVPDANEDDIVRF